MNTATLIPSRGVVLSPLLRGETDRIVTFDAPKPRFQYRGKTYPLIQGGAFGNSGLYVVNLKKPFDGSDLVIDWVNDSCKIALYTNALTPNFSTDTGIGSAPYTANEVTGTGYTAGGVVLASKTVTESPTGTIMFDAADPAWSGATFSSVRGGIIWDDTLVTPADPVLCAITFGADYQVTAGTFTVQFASTGAFYDDVTP